MNRGEDENSRSETMRATGFPGCKSSFPAFIICFPFFLPLVSHPEFAGADRKVKEKKCDRETLIFSMLTQPETCVEKEF